MTTNPPRSRFLYAAGLACAIRLGLYYLAPELTQTLGQRIEFVTPLTSFKRMTEGLHLHAAGFDPYDGNLYFQPALYLPLFQALRTLPPVFTMVFFMAMDVLVAYQLVWIAANKFRRTSTRVVGDKTPADPSCNFPEDINLPLQPESLAFFYLLNPLTILSCLAQSTLIINSFAIVTALRRALEGRLIQSMFWIAVASYISFYPIMLLFPIGVLLINNQPNYKPILMRSLGAFAGSLVGLLSLSYMIVGSFACLTSPLNVILLVTDLTPNLGVYWYFFIEMFDHFRSFFLIAFQMHTFIFAIPVTIRFKNQPLFAAIIILGIMTLFKSYPSIGDMSLLLGLIPLYHELFKYMRYGFVLINAMIYALVLAPLFWHLWIYQGSGNANFFYAATLVYAASQILLVVDLTKAQIKRELNRQYPAVRDKLVVQE
ncbi:hypothetical protein H4R33_000093 [Dimargaris cristalligena]|nr:hypothetical protein H4R33_000093 [Dimargaris cristalligena]